MYNRARTISAGSNYCHIISIKGQRKYDHGTGTHVDSIVDKRYHVGASCVRQCIFKADGANREATTCRSRTHCRRLTAGIKWLKNSVITMGVASFQSPGLQSSVAKCPLFVVEIATAMGRSRNAGQSSTLFIVTRAYFPSSSRAISGET